MNPKGKKLLALLCCALLLLTGCGTDAVSSGQGNSMALVDQLMTWFLPERKYEKSGESEIQVHDVYSLYTEDTTPIVIYMTVPRSNAADKSTHTWEEIHEHDVAWYKAQGEAVWECPVLVQIGNEVGPVYGAFGYDDNGENASVRLSGSKASTRQQKSYHVDLYENSGSIAGIKSFLLQKSFTDPFRFTNKLACDLIATCDGLLSTRTCFAHLYVRNLELDDDAPFLDYGLYTFTEPINKRYLRNRNLDQSGELYKAVDFDFARHEDVIVQPTDARYSAEAFEALLDPKGSKDYSGLIAMLDAVNDLSIPIQDTVDRYFDEESLYSWLAINLLLDNRDTDTENYYLYRPLGSERFYIIPWDYDSALRDDYEVLRDANYSAGWEKGIFLYTKSVLFRRIMESEYCSNELSEYITALHDSVFSARNVYRRARKLADTVLDYLYELPDKSYARVTEANYKRLLELIQDQVDRNFYTYYDTLMTPWPFHILDPEEDEDGRVTLRWEATEAMNQQVTYSLELDTGWDFSDPVLKAVDYEGTSYSAGELAPGQYFLRITAKSEQGYTQEAYEVYNTEKKTTVHGVLCFYIQEVDED